MRPSLQPQVNIQTHRHTDTWTHGHRDTDTDNDAHVWDGQLSFRRNGTSARTRIRWSFTCLVCVSVTTTRACPPRTRHHCNRLPHCCHRRSDRENGFAKLMCYSFGNQHSGTCTRQHSCVFVLFGWVPKHVREHVMAIHAG